MRDFNNNGNVGGNVTIVDQSINEHKLLVQCSTEELLEELPYREENLRAERKSRMQQVLPVIGTCTVVFIGAAAWAVLQGKLDLGTFALGAGSLIIGYGSLNATLRPNDFEIQERQAIREIYLILKARRAR